MMMSIGRKQFMVGKIIIDFKTIRNWIMINNAE